MNTNTNKLGDKLPSFLSKKILIIALVVALLSVTAGGVIALSDSEEVNATATTGTHGDNISWSFENGTLTFTGTGPMVGFKSSDVKPWDSFKNDLTTVIISEGITSIGSNAFSLYTSLTSVIIPDSVTTIGSNAFSNCHKLVNVTIPDSVTTIGSSVFYNCYKLVNVTIPEGVTTIGSWIFYNCTSLTSITFEHLTAPRFEMNSFNLGNTATIYSNNWANDTIFNQTVKGDNTTFTYLPLSSKPTTPEVPDDDLEIVESDVLNVYSGSGFTYGVATTVDSATISLNNTSATWLTYNAETKQITGTAPYVNSVTEYSAIITAIAGSQTVTQTISFKVYPILVLSSVETQQVFRVSDVVNITGTANIPVTWTATGTLPTGLTMVDGVITGTLTTPGTSNYSLIATATDPTQTVTIPITFKVVEILALEVPNLENNAIKGSGVSFTPSVNESFSSSVTYSVTDTDSLFVVSNGIITGSIPFDFASDTYSLIITANTSVPSQTMSEEITFNVDSVLAFTSKPTSAFVTMPIIEGWNGGAIESPLSSRSYFSNYVEAADAIQSTYTDTYKFAFVGLQAETLEWFVNGVSFSTEWSPTYTFTENGTYTIKCVAKNALGESISEQELVVKISPDSGYKWILIIVLAVILFALGAIYYVTKLVYILPIAAAVLVVIVVMIWWL